MDTDIVYILMIMLMIGLSTTLVIPRVMAVSLDTKESAISGANLAIPILIYIALYQYGINSYNTKRMIIGVLSSIYLILMILHYIIISKETTEECQWSISTKKYSEVKTSMYRFVYMMIMLAVPIYLSKSENILIWGLLGPLMIPLFLYISSYLLGLGLDGDGKIVDAGDYYGTFVKGINKDENYMESGLMINILRSVVRGILLIVLFIISFLMSKKIMNVDKTTPSSIIVFLVIISSILPLILGYLIEPKCLLEQAESKEESEGIKCLADKHGGIYGYLMYVLVCGIIIIVKDN